VAASEIRRALAIAVGQAQTPSATWLGEATALRQLLLALAAEEPMNHVPAVRFRRAVRKDRERGATLVEFALICPILFLLIFGIIDFGSVFNDLISLRQGVREGARQGSVGVFGGNSSCNLQSPSGSPETRQLMCLTKNRIGGSTSALRIRVRLNTSNAIGQGLIVCAQRSVSSLSGMTAPFLNNRYMRSKVEIAIENVPTGTNLTNGSENPPSGSNWTWCTANNPSP
jgi:hypothetical protein